MLQKHYYIFWRPKPLSFHKEQYLRLKIGLTNFSCFLEMIFSCFHINLIQNWIFPPLALDFLWIAYRQLFCFLETLSKLTLWSRLQTAPFSQGKPSMFYSHKGTISKQYDAVSTKLHLFLQRYFSHVGFSSSGLDGVFLHLCILPSTPLLGASLFISHLSFFFFHTSHWLFQKASRWQELFKNDN